MNKNADAEATPEQLLTLLALQLAAQRQQRKARSRSRPLILAGSLLLIVCGAVAAFFVLHEMLMNMGAGEGRAPAPPADLDDSGKF